MLSFGSKITFKLKKDVRNTPAQIIRTSLSVFFKFRLKSGLSNEVLSTLFNISKSRAIPSESFTKLGSTAYITWRGHWKAHETCSADFVWRYWEFTGGDSSIRWYLHLYPKKKNNNFHFQRRSYTVQKGRPLVKAMVAVTATGHFVTAVGLYLADNKNNNANILTLMLKSNFKYIKHWVQEKYMFVVDRGFRCATSLLKDMGIQSEMPCFMKRGDK